jgi:hypothetical protein
MRGTQIRAPFSQQILHVKPSGEAQRPPNLRVLQNKKRAVIDRAYSLENIRSIVGAVYDRPLFLRVLQHPST